MLQLLLVPMKYIVFLTFILCPLSCYSQKDSTIFIADYIVKYQDCEEDDTLLTDIFRLKVGERYVHYFSNKYNYYHTMKMGGELDNDALDYKAVIKGLPKGLSSCGYWIMKDLEKRKMMFEIRFDTAYEEDIPIINWQLEDVDSVICEHVCHKANATFRGRMWHAWYTLDIPSSEGPWKLNGLPGLILYAYDSKGQFYFDCICLKEGKGYPINYNRKRLKFASPKRVQDLYLLERSDEDDYYLKMAGWIMGERFDKNGNPEKFMPKTRCLLDYIE